MDDRQTASALVLAGSRGLGYAAAEGLVEDGIPVGICARSAEGVESAVAELARRGKIVGFPADVTKADEINMAAQETRRQLGPVGILIANAGGPPGGNFDETSIDDWNRAYALTVLSFVHAVHAVLPDMRGLSQGRVILIGSSSIRRPIPNLVLSNTLRPALNGLVKDLAVHLAPDNITVNMVAPGRIDTDRVRQLDVAAASRSGKSAGEVRKDSERSIPVGRYGRPRELAALVRFLASSDASYITGQSILVDGGLVSSLP